MKYKNICLAFAAFAGLTTALVWAQESDRPKARPGESGKGPPPRREADDPDFPPPRREGAGPMGPGGPPRGPGGPMGPGNRGPEGRGPDGRPPPPPPRDGERNPLDPYDLPRGRRPPPPPRDGFGPGYPEDDPAMAELVDRDRALDQEAHEVANRLRTAPTAEREKLKKRLEEVVNKHFDVRQERRDLQLKRMEEELKRLKEVIGKRNEARDQIVKKHLAELIGEQGELEF